MSKKSDKPTFTPSRRYTTRDIMEITEKRRLKKEAEAKAELAASKIVEKNPIVEKIDLPLLASQAQTAQVTQEIKKFTTELNWSFTPTVIPEPSVLEIPRDQVKDSQRMIDAPTGDLADVSLDIPNVIEKTPIIEKIDQPVLVAEAPTPPVIQEIKKFSASSVPEMPKKQVKDIQMTKDVPIRNTAELSLVIPIVYFSSILMLPSAWFNIWAEGLNRLILHGSYLMLKISQKTTVLQDAFLHSHNYKVSLQGDWLSFYSMIFLSVFSLFIAILERTTWLKTAMIFVSVIPLVIGANILRVVTTSGVALNYGFAEANQYFYGLSQFLVLDLTILGVLFFTLMSRKEKV